MVVKFCGDQIFMGFLSMTVYEVYIHGVKGTILAAPDF